jgi:hypothetical protein
MSLGIGLYYKINNDKRVFFAYALNSALLTSLLYNRNSKFFIPHWLKKSFTGYMTFLLVLGSLSYLNSTKIQEPNSNDEILHKVQYRYIKELSGILY